MKDSNNQLKRALIANAIFSGLSGLALLLAADTLNEFMNLSNTLALRLVGIGLLVFVVQLIGAIRKPGAKVVRMIIIQDWLWVLGTAVIIALNLFDISFEGKMLMTIVAAIVGGMAVTQGYFLRKALRT